MLCSAEDFECFAFIQGHIGISPSQMDSLMISLSFSFPSRASERSHLALSLRACEMTASPACPPVEWAVVLDSESEIKRAILLLWITDP